MDRRAALWGANSKQGRSDMSPYESHLYTLHQRIPQDVRFWGKAWRLALNTLWSVFSPAGIILLNQRDSTQAKQAYLPVELVFPFLVRVDI